MNVGCRLGEWRRRRGLSAPELARAAGVTRQALYAIEGGRYLPNTEVALKLARALESTVEELFPLTEESAGEAPMRVESLSSAEELRAGTPVRLARLGKKVIAAPAWPAAQFLPAADATMLDARRAAAWRRPEEALLIAGCDPALGLLAEAIEREARVRVTPVAASSSQALEWLRAGKVHVAGTHLYDSASGEFNLPQVGRLLKRRPARAYTFAEWEEGLVVRKGNPYQVRTVADLTRRGLRFLNREKGSGSRALLDRLLKKEGVPAREVEGYARTAPGHLPAAMAVAAGAADACLAASSAARALDLDFIPLQPERYDFVIPEAHLELPAVKAMLEILQRASFARRLSAVAGYEVRRTGARLT